MPGNQAKEKGWGGQETKQQSLEWVHWKQGTEKRCEGGVRRERRLELSYQQTREREKV